ncbi:site-specific integrase [Aquimarina sediminis]|uniref:site-specific integrase n=1 Tax=Aquimarina sediminis TaxID=2070536 RepID=UPI000CA031CE|nr:site-specific integrase [Aquimarina sediminis]
MASIKKVLHPKNEKGNKIYRLAIRVTVNRKTSYLYLGHNIKLKDWNEQNNKVKTSHIKHAQLNRLIRKKYDQIEDLIFEFESANKTFTAKQITSFVKNENKNKTFFELANEYLVNLEKTGKFKRAKSDKSRLKCIEEFHKSNHLAFQEIDILFLKKLKVYLISYQGVSERTVMNIFVLVRTLYNIAIKEAIVKQDNYPFGKGKVQIKFPETIKIGLEDYEIKAIEDLDLEKGTTTHHTRNVFLFSFYLAGIRISDVLEMKWNSIRDGRITYQMGKNNKVDSLKLPIKVMKILEYYENDKTSNNDYIFPELKRANPKDPEDIYRKTNTAVSKFNKHLKKIAQLAKIDKKITTHIARHSFGNIAGDKISPRMLQKLYRHSHLTTTIGYQGNFIHKDADDALDSVLKF